MAFNFSQFGQNAATAGVQAVANGLLGLAGARLQYKYNKKLMAQQNKYAIDAFNRENERQDYLLANSASIMRQNLQNAGYSAADPNGSGVQTPSQASITPPSNPSASMPDLGKFDLMQAKLINAQSELIEAQKEKVVSETEGQDIQNWLNRTYGEQQWQASIRNLDAQSQNQVSQALYKDQQKLNEMKLTDAQVDNIEQRLDMDWQRLPVSLQLMTAQAYQAEASGDLSHAEVNKVYQDIRESMQRIVNLQHEVGLTDAQVGVAIQLAANYAKQNNILGFETTSAKAKAEVDQFERDVKTSMGLRYYQARNVAEAVLPIGAVAGLIGRSFGLGK